VHVFHDVVAAFRRPGLHGTLKIYIKLMSSNIAFIIYLNPKKIHKVIYIYIYHHWVARKFHIITLHFASVTEISSTTNKITVLIYYELK